MTFLPAGNKCLQSIAASPGVSLVIGPVDAGKSTFCLLAANRALQAGRKIAVVDADPGQSDIGPPACLGMALLTGQVHKLEELAPTALYFLGTTSPMGHLLEVAGGTAHLVQRALESGADTIIVNTSGLVKGPGRALKSAKIRLLSPQHLVSIAPHDETEAILTSLRNRKLPAIHRLQPSSRVVVRSTCNERRRRRRASLPHILG